MQPPLAIDLDGLVDLIDEAQLKVFLVTISLMLAFGILMAVVERVRQLRAEARPCQK